MVLDRNENAAINRLNKALNEVGIILSACGDVDINQPVKQETFETWILIICVLEAPVIISDLTGGNFTTRSLYNLNQAKAQKICFRA
ncbi:MAG: hypothetical protein QNJ74_02160 [Trichodesmium sp. MO_231.B1]|nr:hypothetical protein [Trichodesmium sp. MO_231.B1]